VLALLGIHLVVAAAVLDGIRAQARIDGIVATVAFQLVVATTARKDVVARAAPDGVVALAAFEVVVAGGTGHEVVAVAAVDDVVALAAAQVVVAGVAEDVVAARAAVHGVVACAGIDAVVSAAAHDEVVAGAAVGDDVDGDVGVDPDRVVAVAGADADLLPLGQRGRIAFAVDVDVDRTVLARAHVDAVVVRTAGRGVDDELVAGDAAAIDADIEGAFAPDLEAVARVQHVLLDRLAVRGGRILARYRIAVVAVDVRRCRTQRGGRREVRI